MAPKNFLYLFFIEHAFISRAEELRRDITKRIKTGIVAERQEGTGRERSKFSQRRDGTKEKKRIRLKEKKKGMTILLSLNSQ